MNNYSTLIIDFKQDFVKNSLLLQLKNEILWFLSSFYDRKLNALETKKVFKYFILAFVKKAEPLSPFFA